MTRCAVMSVEKHRNLIFNKPFWVVMKQKGGHPYFICQINNTQYMQE